MAADQRDVFPRHAERLRQEGQERLVCLAFNRGRRKTDAQRIAMYAGNLGALRARLSVNL